MNGAIDLGMTALAVSMKAKAGLLNERDRVELLMTVLRHAAEDVDWRQRALAFVEQSRVEPFAAGQVLHDWIAGPAKRHAWQDRADIDG